jgi:GrpB-like predicted nucleotidyltransferase (UPF0157 family)
MNNDAQVVPYDPAWPGLFSQLRDRVDTALAAVPHVTEHVGSTAVPGLPAKPVIDLDVVVPDETAAETAVRMLAAAGWQHEGDLGIAGREAFRPPADAAYHHLYVVVSGSQPHRDHSFKIYLVDPPAAGLLSYVVRSLVHRTRKLAGTPDERDSRH